VTLVETSVYGGGPNGDRFKFDDGTTVSSYLVRSPITIGVKPQPVTGKPGVKMVNAAIKEALATVQPAVRRNAMGRFIKA
jgi:methionine aminopeptidase